MDTKTLDALQKTINAKIHTGTGEFGLDSLLMDCSTAIQHLRSMLEVSEACNRTKSDMIIDAGLNK